MNIVQLANFYAPRSGGLRVAVDALRVGYHDHGHNCTAIVPGMADTAGPTIRTIRSPKLMPGSDYRIMTRPAALRSLLDELRPDHLEIHDKFLPAWISTWATRNGVPMVLVSHERLTDTLPSLFPYLPLRATCAAARAITRNAAGRCDAIVTCSAYAAAEFGSTPVHVIPLGVDLDTFRSTPAAIRLDGRTRLAVVGRLSPEKHVDLAIDTLELLTRGGIDADLTVVGRGPGERSLRQRSTGLPVTFHGHEPDRSRLVQLLSSTDVVLVPGPVETFGLAALEALACGTAVVGVAGCGVAELLEGHPDAGIAVAADAAAFATAVQDLLAVPRQSREQAARARAENYSWPATVAAMLGIHAGLGSRAVPSSVGS